MHDPAFQQAAQRVRTNPQDAQSWHDLGVLLQQRGEIDRANECFQRVQHLGGLPHSPRPHTDSPTIQALLADGRELDVLWFHNALLLFMTILNNIGLQSTAPTMMYDQDAFRAYRSDCNAETEGLSGQYFLSLVGEPDPQELAYIQAAYNQNPSSPVLTMCIGFSHLRIDQRETWGGYMEKAYTLADHLMQTLALGEVRTFYQNLFARYFLVMSCFVERKSDLWIESLHKALQIGGEALEQITCALQHDSMGQQLCIDIADVYALMARNIFDMKAEQGDVDQAIQWYSEAIILRPDNGYLYDLLGLCYIMSEGPEQAREAWERGMRQDPIVDIQQNLAYAYLLEGDTLVRGSNPARGVALLERALELELALPLERQRNQHIADIQRMLSVVQEHRHMFEIFGPHFDEDAYREEKERLRRATMRQAW